MIARRLAQTLAVLVASTAGIVTVASPAFASPSFTSLQSTQRAQSVSLQSIKGQAGNRTYVANVFDNQGELIGNADLDLGALGSDPDLRVPTVPMQLSGNKSYKVSVNIPANGDWIVVVRVHSPTQLVELFTDKVADVSSVQGGHSNAGFSRAAVLKADPTFYDRYSPSHGTSTNDIHTASSDFLNDLHPRESRGLDPTGLISMLIHSAGAIAWLLAILGLVVAHRMGPGSARNELLSFVATRYRLLAGGGLLVLLTTGLINMDRSSYGLLQPRALLETNLGTIYLAVFGFKISLFAASLLTTRKIDRLLNGSLLDSYTSDGQSGVGSTALMQTILLKLAERNLMLGAAILISVTVLSQLHQALH